MIYVEYRYFKKSDWKWHDGVSTFDSPYTASRFIRAIASRKNMIYDGFTADESDECEELERLL